MILQNAKLFFNNYTKKAVTKKEKKLIGKY